MNKTNLEIIRESIFEFFNVREKILEGNREEGQITVFCQLVTLNELSDFAKNLVRKLNRLDKSKLTELIYYISDVPRQSILELAGWKIKEAEEYIKKRRETADKIIDQILQLVPEEGKVIIEGKVLFSGGNIYIDSDNEWEWTTKLSVELEDNYKGKKIQLIIREVK